MFKPRRESNHCAPPGPSVGNYQCGHQLAVTGYPTAGGNGTNSGGYSSNFWSASANANNSDNAWNVNFNNGNSNNNNRNNNKQVRLVRGGEWLLASATFAALYEAWLHCRRRKRKTPQAQRYEVGLLDNLMTAVQTLRERSWLPSPPVCFVVTQPKGREVHAASFADRVVHHYLVPQLERLFEPVFIDDLYSNRRNKGTHKAVQRLQTFMRRLQGEAQQQAHLSSPPHYLQLDVANFFNTIDRPRLFVMLQKALANGVRKQIISPQKANELRWLCHTILKQDVATESQLISSAAEYRQVPAHKRMSNAGENKALPIGNLTSQLFANVYLNGLDQFIKHTLKCRFYIRYVDDMILLHHSREQLVEWQQAIAVYLGEQLGLKLRSHVALRSISNGADFLGYIVRPHYRLVRRRVVASLWVKLKAFERNAIDGNVNKGWTIKLASSNVQQLRSVLASYWGHFSHANSYHLQQHIWRRFAWLGLLFRVHQQRLVPLWQPSSASSFLGQRRYFQRLFPRACINIQKGWQTESWSAVLNRREALLNPLLNQVTQVYIGEQGYLARGLKRRCLQHLTIQPGVILCVP
jgi:RNA-directed DNA polymerase